MKTSVENPPVTLIARPFGSSKVETTLPRVAVNHIIILSDECVNIELTEAFMRLDERIKKLSAKAREIGNGRRVSELRYFEHNLGLLKNIGDPKAFTNNQEMAEIQNGFRRIYERAELELSQFIVEGNTRKCVEIEYVLDDLKNLKKKAAKYAIEL